MTLVLCVIGRETVWALTDRRLTTASIVVREDARKVMLLETRDGRGILAYAGLGATAAGTEPADWMSSVLRGRNLNFERSLAVLADAMRRELPRHLRALPRAPIHAHHVLAAAIVNEEPRLYSIDLARTPDGITELFRHTRWVRSTADTPLQAPRFGLAGTGGVHLSRQLQWRRPLLRLVRAHDRKVISAGTVARSLATLCDRVSRELPDGSVGANSIVVWRNRPTGVHRGGGGHEFYSAGVRDANTPSLPLISTGTDMRAVLDILMSEFLTQLEEQRRTGHMPEQDTDAVNARLAQLPETPDERLR